MDLKSIPRFDVNIKYIKINNIVPNFCEKIKFVPNRSTKQFQTLNLISNNLNVV